MEYHALWVDDHWSENANASDRAFLERADSLAEQELSRLKLRLHWSYSTSPGDVALRELWEGRDFRLAIVDHDFQGSGFKGSATIHHLGDKRVPYFVFTRFAENVRCDARYDQHDPLCLGVIEKTDDGSLVLAKRIAEFFRAPPIRVLHISDLHYDSQSEGIAHGKKHEEQEDLLRALIDMVAKCHSETPIDAIALTGDFAHKDPQRDLVAVRSVVQDLIAASVTMQRLECCFIVPGNHDIAWKEFASELGEAPWTHFLDFYRAIFGSREDLLAEMQAWDTRSRLHNWRARRHDLCWTRTPRPLRMSVVGLVTPMELPEKCGTGIFSRDDYNIIERVWQSSRTHGEIRLALMHHNLLAALSLSRFDEKHVLENAGDSMYALMSHACSAVLSGHTHTANFFSLEAAKLQFRDMRRLGDLKILSAGTTGGLSGSLDRPRCFNVLEFGDARGEAGMRNLEIRVFAYEATERSWIESERSIRPAV